MYLWTPAGFEMHLWTCKMNALISRQTHSWRVVLRPPCVRCLSHIAQGEDVMAAALAVTEVMNEFTHNQELIARLAELVITLELTSRAGSANLDHGSFQLEGAVLGY